MERFSKFGLSVSPEKTKIVKIGKAAWQRWRRTGEKPESFNFLGFTHYCATSRNGSFSMRHKTSKENLVRKLKEIQEWVKNIRNLRKLREWWPTIKAKLTGHYNYFGISGNYRCLRQFYYLVLRVVFKWINRRSQRKSMTWEMFQQYLQWNPLPTPRICHVLYTVKPKK